MNKMAKNTAVAKPQPKKEKKAENGVIKAKTKLAGTTVKDPSKQQKIKKTKLAAVEATAATPPEQKITKPVAEPAQKKNKAVAKPAQKGTKAVAKPAQKETTAVAKPAQKETKAVAKPAQKGTKTVAKPAQKETKAVAKPAKKENKAVAKPTQKKKAAQQKAATPKPEGLVSVFVGNLPVNIKRKKIVSTFGKFGKIFGIRLRRPNGGRFFKTADKVAEDSLIAFIDYGNNDDAKSSTTMNGEQIGDNIIRVQVHLNKKIDKAAIIASYDPKRTVFIGNLPYGANDQNLIEAFSCCGDIDYVRVLHVEAGKKGCNGTAYVCFKDAASVGMALELNGNEFLGRDMRVQRYNIKTVASDKKKEVKKVGKTGAERRVEGKNKKAGTEFAGTKTTDNKMKKKPNKSGLTGPKLLAKKIAPRKAPITA